METDRFRDSSEQGYNDLTLGQIEDITEIRDIAEQMRDKLRSIEQRGKPATGTEKDLRAALEKIAECSFWATRYVTSQ